MSIVLTIYPWRASDPTSQVPLSNNLEVSPGIGAGLTCLWHHRRTLQASLFPEPIRLQSLEGGELAWCELPGPATKGADAVECIISQGQEIDRCATILKYVRAHQWTADLNQDPETEGFFEEFFGEVVRALQEAAGLLYDQRRRRESYVMPLIDFVSEYFSRHDEDPADRALIVELAELLPSHLRDIRNVPKRILHRIREDTRLDRLQELDSHCLIDYARRPGRTPPEKAGRNQRLLSVQRMETINTLENRVVLDLCRRSVHEARRYMNSPLHRKIGESGSQRIRTVRDYEAFCRRFVVDPSFSEVQHLAQPCRVPNYALLQNPRYVEAWRSYEKLLREIELKEVLWRWPRRLWGDLVKLLMMKSFSDLQSRFPLHIHNPLKKLLKIEKTPNFGRWFRSSPFPGPLVIETQTGAAMSISLLAHEDVNQLPSPLRKLTMCNADAYVVWGPNNQGEISVLPVWGIVGDASWGDSGHADRLAKEALVDVETSMRRIQASWGTSNSDIRSVRLSAGLLVKGCWAEACVGTARHSCVSPSVGGVEVILLDAVANVTEWPSVIGKISDIIYECITRDMRR
jgi:hypothetical protein